MEPEICTKLSQMSCHYTWLLHGLDDAFLEVFQPQASPVEGQSLQQKKRKGEKKGEKKIPKIEKPKDVGHFLVSKF